MTVVFVPPPQPSRKAKELGAAIAHLAIEYQSREGKMNGMELRMAIQIAQTELRKRQKGAGDKRPFVIIMAIALALVLLAGVLVLSYSLR